MTVLGGVESFFLFSSPPYDITIQYKELIFFDNYFKTQTW